MVAILIFRAARRGIAWVDVGVEGGVVRLSVEEAAEVRAAVPLMAETQQRTRHLAAVAAGRCLVPVLAAVAVVAVVLASELEAPPPAAVADAINNILAVVVQAHLGVMVEVTVALAGRAAVSLTALGAVTVALLEGVVVAAVVLDMEPRRAAGAATALRVQSESGASDGK